MGLTEDEERRLAQNQRAIERHEQAVFLCDAIESAGESPRSYSGRGMYGRECVGVTTDDPFKLIVDVLMTAEDDEEREKLAKILRNAQAESMVKSTIVYFRGCPWPYDNGEGGG